MHHEEGYIFPFKVVGCIFCSFCPGRQGFVSDIYIATWGFHMQKNRFCMLDFFHGTCMVINRFLALREIFHRRHLQIKIQCASFRFISFVWILVEHLCILYYSSSLSVVMFVNADTGLHSVLLQQCLEVLTF